MEREATVGIAMGPADRCTGLPVFLIRFLNLPFKENTLYMVGYRGFPAPPKEAESSSLPLKRAGLGTWLLSGERGRRDLLGLPRAGPKRKANSFCVPSWAPAASKKLGLDSWVRSHGGERAREAEVILGTAAAAKLPVEAASCVPAATCPTWSGDRPS